MGRPTGRDRKNITSGTRHESQSGSSSGRVEDLKALREFETDLRICEAEIKKLARQQQELTYWNCELREHLQDLTYQVHTLGNGSDDGWKRPHEIEMGRKPIFY